MGIELKFWGKGDITRVYVNDENGNSLGYMQEKLAPAWSRLPNTYVNTIDTETFRWIMAAVEPYLATITRGEIEDLHIFSALTSHAFNYQPVGMSAKSTKALRMEQKKRVAEFGRTFASA